MTCGHGFRWNRDNVSTVTADAMHAKLDPQALMTLIRETHLTNVDGAVRDKDMEALTLQTEFLTLAQQPGTTSLMTCTSHTSKQGVRNCPKSKSLFVS